MYNSINDAALAALGELKTALNLTSVPYSEEVATTLKSIADVYKTYLSSGEKNALADASGHFNAASDSLYHLLEIVKTLIVKNLPTLTLTVGIAPTPAEDVAANDALVTSVSISNGTVTIVADPDDLSIAEGPPSEGNHKYVALGIGTGLTTIKGVLYNGSYTMTDDDVAEATSVGLSAGSFVIYVKVDELVEEDRVITLSATGYPTSTITIKLSVPAAGGDSE